jgi:hypothetical protein
MSAIPPKNLVVFGKLTGVRALGLNLQNSGIIFP